jgi:dUTP pyrophosphatase
LLNAPGVIDADYRGEIKAIMVNLSGRPFIVEHGDRVAQLLVMPYERILWIEATELSDTARGSNGFGSSGIS